MESRIYEAQRGEGVGDDSVIRGGRSRSPSASLRAGSPLRARPTRKRSEPERQSGRSGRDDKTRRGDDPVIRGGGAGPLRLRSGQALHSASARLATSDSERQGGRSGRDDKTREGDDSVIRGGGAGPLRLRSGQALHSASARLARRSESEIQSGRSGRDDKTREGRRAARQKPGLRPAF